MSDFGGALVVILAIWVLIGLIFPRLHEKNVTLHDGRTVHCLVSSTLYARSYSCDWDHAKKVAP